MTKQEKPQSQKTTVDPADRTHVKKAPQKWGLPFVLAVVVHAALFIGLFVVFQWNRVSDEVVYAELWSPAEVAAMPDNPVKVEEPEKAEEAEVKPEPEPKEPEPEPEPQAQKQEVAPEPQDVIEKEDEEKKKLEEQKRLEEEKRLQEQKRLEEKRKAEERKAQQRRREQAKKLAEQMQKQEMERLKETSQNNAAGVVASAGGISQSAVYNTQVATCVRRNLFFSVTPDMKSGQYRAIYEVQLLENGQQAAAPKLLKASGLPAFDHAVESAIRQCDPFPVPASGRAPARIQLTFDPVDSNR